MPSEAGILRRVARLARALRISRPVMVLNSMIVGVPTVIGWLRPVILLPVGLATGLSPERLEAILLHELAHIRRMDYLVNLLQRLVEAVLFYHPAVWFISRRIRIERENCCDDVTLAACGGDRTLYAEALLAVAGPRAPCLAMAANGGKLLPRIRRILGLSSAGASPSAWVSGGLALLLIVGMVVVPMASSMSAARADKGAETKAAATQAATQLSTLATERAEALKKNIKNFTLSLNYYGKEYPPYNSLFLSVPALPFMGAGAGGWSPELRVQITEDQAKKIIDYLATEGFLDRAKSVKRLEFVAPQGPVYVLESAGIGEENLGWGRPLLQRLDGLRTVLEGDAAKNMDMLLGRLAGEREEWKKPAATQPTVGLSKLVGQEVTLTGTYGGPGKIADYITLNATECVYLKGKSSGLNPFFGEPIRATGTLRV